MLLRVRFQRFYTQYRDKNMDFKLRVIKVTEDKNKCIIKNTYQGMLQKAPVSNQNS